MDGRMKLTVMDRTDFTCHLFYVIRICVSCHMKPSSIQRNAHIKRLYFGTCLVVIMLIFIYNLYICGCVAE